MRKKSHISLAKYIVKDMEVPVMTDHRKAFYLGSILPDCKPSFLTQRHEFEGTFEMVKERICDLSLDAELILRNARAFMRRLGEIIHYIADYFTFPHNNHYDGNVKDHCYYERDLKHEMKAFLATEEAFEIKEQVAAYDSMEELSSYIRSIHNSYMKLKHTVQEDIRYIVHVCTTVVKSVLNMVSRVFRPVAVNIQYV